MAYPLHTSCLPSLTAHPLTGMKNDRTHDQAILPPARAPNWRSLWPHASSYLTRSAPCPYLPHRQERKLVVPLAAQDAARQYQNLSAQGFRRSQTLAWIPACEHCSACRALRIVASEFRLKAHWRRLHARNQQLRCQRAAGSTQEQFDLLHLYLGARHAASQMTQLARRDYDAMTAPTSLQTDILEYRQAGRLVGVMLRDRLAHGASLVYSFFDPAMAAHSLGSWMILHNVLAMQAEQRAYVYLGHWIEGCKSMAYKTRWTPYEILTQDGWQRHD